MAYNTRELVRLLREKGNTVRLHCNNDSFTTIFDIAASEIDRLELEISKSSQLALNTTRVIAATILSDEEANRITNT